MQDHQEVGQIPKAQIQPQNYKLQTPLVGIIMGSDSDLSVMEAAAES
jgi:hypothetical protein